MTTVADLPVVSERGEDQWWKALGRCSGQDPNVWFPERGGAVGPAKRECGNCPVRLLCLAYALARNERMGIWGGLTERERRRVRRGLPLSIDCRYCGHGVKAGKVDQATCNRQVCREAHRRWVGSRQVVGVAVQMSFSFDVPTTVAEFAAAVIVEAAAVSVPPVAVAV